MQLHEINEIAYNKLILLYLLQDDSVSFDVDSLTDFVLEHDIMNYFLVKQYTGELLKTKLIRDVGTLRLTKEGKKTFLYFSDDLGDDKKKALKKALKEYDRKNKIKETADAEYYTDSQGKHFVCLELQENDDRIFSLTLEVPSEEEGKIMIREWKTRTATIYQNIIGEFFPISK